MTCDHLWFEGRVFHILSPSVLHYQDRSNLLQLKSKSYGFQITAKFHLKTRKGSCFQGKSKHSTISGWQATWTNFGFQPSFFTNSRWSSCHYCHQQRPLEKKTNFWKWRRWKSRHYCYWQRQKEEKTKSWN